MTSAAADKYLTPLLQSLHTLAERYEDFAAQLAAAELQAQQLRARPDADLAGFQTTLVAMLDPAEQQDPYLRAAAGRVLGLLDLDLRPGVGLNAAGLPAIDWVEIPAGEFIYQKGERLTLPKFYISRYHVTRKQFEVFLNADDGFADPRWWAGLAEKKERLPSRKRRRIRCSVSGITRLMGRAGTTRLLSAAGGRIVLAASMIWSG